METTLPTYNRIIEVSLILFGLLYGITGYIFLFFIWFGIRYSKDVSVTTIIPLFLLSYYMIKIIGIGYLLGLCSLVYLYFRRYTVLSKLEKICTENGCTEPIKKVIFTTQYTIESSRTILTNTIQNNWINNINEVLELFAQQGYEVVKYDSELLAIHLSLYRAKLYLVPIYINKLMDFTPQFQHFLEQFNNTQQNLIIESEEKVRKVTEEFSEILGVLDTIKKKKKTYKKKKIV